MSGLLAELPRKCENGKEAISCADIWMRMRSQLEVKRVTGITLLPTATAQQANRLIAHRQRHPCDDYGPTNVYCTYGVYRN